MGRPIRPFVPARLVDDELAQRNFEDMKRITDELRARAEATPALLNGAGAPSASLGSDGDWYLNRTTHLTYVKVRGAWV